jgi:hypothetical protein
MTNAVPDDVLSSMLNVATKHDIVVVGSQTIRALVAEVRTLRASSPLPWKVFCERAPIRPLHVSKEAP